MACGSAILLYIFRSNMWKITIPVVRKAANSGRQHLRRRCTDGWKSYSTNWSKGEGESGRGRRRAIQWFGIPVGLGVTCLALLQLQRTVRRERRQERQRGEGEERPTWQLAMFQLVPARLLSRCWGKLMEKEIPPLLRQPLLGLYIKMFGCEMEEALLGEVSEYQSFMALFTRELKDGARPISTEHLVSPADGRVLHLGRVGKNGRLEQIKGVTYPLHRFLGQKEINTPLPNGRQQSNFAQEVTLDDSGPSNKMLGNGTGRQRESELYHITIYLAPGDYHGFHSPANWRANTRRHFPGELLTVAPWAARTMPGLFALNERALLLGQWKYGFFSLSAVGAYNVGKISLTIDQDMKTNQKGRYVYGQFADKALGSGPKGLILWKGQKLGTFQMGSSIVVVFEAPMDFQFTVQPGDRVNYGQHIGHISGS